MLQTTLCVPLEVKPESCIRLSSLLDQLRRDLGEVGTAGTASYERITRQVTLLHFMSMSVFPGSDYDPLFVLEANFDGPPGPFWGQLEACCGAHLRAIVRCCKRPLDTTRELYDAVTRQGSNAPLAPYLEARTQRPSVFHQGNRGLSRDRILAEYALFRDVSAELDQPPATGRAYHALAPDALHDALRKAMQVRHPWLSEPAPDRISVVERIVEPVRIALYVLLLMMALSTPGLLLAACLPVQTDLAIMVVVATVMSGLSILKRRGLDGTEIKASFSMTVKFLLRRLIPIIAAIILLGAIYVVCASILLSMVIWVTSQILHFVGRMMDLVGLLRLSVDFASAFSKSWPVVTLGLLSLLLLTLPTLVFVLRRNELQDSSQDSPSVGERLLREMYRREDWVAQNHMASIVLIKPGILRTIVIRTGHLGLLLVLRLVARDGYLGSMRTVHFAHWAFLNNGSRLLFCSNFDHSWGSYLDDFIEKAHAGLTLAWSCGVGFPPTRFLVGDGASNGRQFKNWALASRAVSRFWYSAYPDLTVDQVERNNRIANSLRKPQVTASEAEQWMLDL